MGRRIYISGPMTGVPEFNAPAFREAADLVRAAGDDPVNPAELCDPSWTWQQCMRADIAALCTCDAILLLPGWERSNGAQLELHIAHRIGLEILHAEKALAT